MKRYIVLFVESWHFINIDNFDEYENSDSVIFDRQNILVTLQSSDLIQHFKSQKRLKILPSIIDFECFDKQMAQEGKEYRSYTDWKAIHSLRHHKIIDSDFEFKKNNIKLLLEHLATLFLMLLEKDEIETNRFITIESRINSIIYERQFKGIRIDFEMAKKKCLELEKEIYKIKNILQLEHKIFTPEIEKLQLAYLESKNYNFIKSTLYSFKIRKNHDIVCLHFYDLLRNTQDLDSMIFILSHWGGYERTYPKYLGFGSTTSRITLRQPSLQNLRKPNRTIIMPDKGMKLLYIDYSQFEAGILASLSEDDTLISLYNSDIYSDFAETVLGDKDKRSDAKIMFYRYMYGDETLSIIVKGYFSKFKKLEDFRKNLQKGMLTNKRIGTSEGNYRYCMDNQYTWALSHLIQSTASLIYKKSLIRVKREIREAEFLIPMHDGTLYQIGKYNYPDICLKIENIYKEEFKKVCPKIDPKMNSSELFN